MVKEYINQFKKYVDLIYVLEFLARAVYISVDPYMRVYSVNFPIGSTMIGEQVAKYCTFNSLLLSMCKYKLFPLAVTS